MWSPGSEIASSDARKKVTSQQAAPVQPIDVQVKRFNHVHIDLVGPLPEAEDGSTYLLTMVDRTTRWLEAVPLRSMGAAACADAFIGMWVAHYGVPAVVTTDIGRQFTSAVWAALCQRLNIDHITRTAYHPHSNGMIERTHSQLKDVLRSRLAGPQWPEGGPQGGQRGVQRPPHPAQPAAVYTRDPCAGGGGGHAIHAVSYAEAASGLQHLQQAEFVYVRKGGIVPPLSPLYQGPYRILDRREKFFKLEVGARHEVVSIDR
jgi:cleavage and polyadenylation specificity factor subunit 1